jgi:outer membrane protein
MTRFVPFVRRLTGGLLVCVLFLMPSRALAQETRAITIDEAVEIALERNVTLRQASNNLDAQAAQVLAERGDFLPSLNASLTPDQRYGTTYDLTAGSFTSEQTQSFSGTVRTNLNLFNGFADVASLDQAQETLAQRSNTVERARQTVVFDVISTFLDVISNREQIRIREENLESQQQQLEQIREFTRVGSRPISDLYQQEAAAAQAEFQVLEAERQLQLSRTRLIQTLQLDPFGAYDFVVSELDEETALVPDGYDLDTLLREAFSRRADLEAQELAISASRHGIRVARSGYWPSVNLSGSVNGNYSSTTEDDLGIGFSDQVFDDRRSERIALSVDVPLFNRFQTRNQVQQAQVRHENARLGLEALRQDVALQVRQAYLDYQTATKNLDVTEKQLRAAERALQAAEERYDVGAATLVELSQVRADYVQAASDRANARYNFIFQEKLIEYYTGSLNPSGPLFE